MGYKQPQTPAAPDVEYAILGCLLKDPAAYDRLGGLLPEVGLFHTPRHQMIYGAILTLIAHQEPIDITTVSAELHRRDHLQKIGGRLYLVEAVEQIASTANVRNYARVLVEKWRYRKIIDISTEAIESASKSEMPPAEIAAFMSTELVVASRDNVKSGLIRVSDVTAGLMEHLDEVQRGVTTLGISTGFHQLDMKTGGWQKGDLIIVAGRPSMGKTAFMNCSATSAVKRGKTVVFSSAETDRDQFTLRVLCTHARLDSLKIKRGDLRDVEWQGLTQAVSDATGWNYYVDGTDKIEINRLTARVAELHQKQPIDVLFVDYLQKLTGGQKFEGPHGRRLEINYIVNQLKNLAQSLNIPVVAGCQVGRGAEIRGGAGWQSKKPTLADLKETGEIENIADLVIGLFRPELYITKKKQGEMEWANKALIILMKQRNGPTGEFTLSFDPVFTLFQDEPEPEVEMPF